VSELAVETQADLWIKNREARAGTDKNFLFEGRIVQVHIPPAVADGTLVRLPRLRPRALSFLGRKDVFVKIHVFDTESHPIDSSPYADDELNMLVESLAERRGVRPQIDPQPLYAGFEESLSVEEYAQAIFDNLRVWASLSWDALPPITFRSMDAPARLAVKMIGGRVEHDCIEVNSVYRYHVRVLGVALAHELMHFIARMTGLENLFRETLLRVGSSFRQKPTDEVLIDVASILAGAGNLYEEAISVWPNGMRQVLGYMHPSLITKTKSLAVDFLRRGRGELERKRLERYKQMFEREFASDLPKETKLPKCRRCGRTLVQADLGHWTCKECGGQIDVV
jgi:hypothetical protein